MMRGKIRDMKDWWDKGVRRISRIERRIGEKDEKKTLITKDQRSQG